VPAVNSILHHVHTWQLITGLAMNSVQFHVLSDDALLRPVLLSVPKVTTRQCTGQCNRCIMSCDSGWEVCCCWSWFYVTDYACTEVSL